MVTQEQIARKLGVSRQLVTFALAGYPQVGEKSRQRILDAARAMGYHPNPHARALRRNRTGIIALWVPDQISTHNNHVARELNRLVKQARHELIISEVVPADAKQILSHVPVDGVIAVDLPSQLDYFNRQPPARPIPMVSMGANCFGETDAVLVDLEAGTGAVMSHLLDSGFRRIAHATFVREDQFQASRRIGYQKAMRKARLKPEFIYYPLTDLQRPVIRELIKDYICQNGCPEAIFCHSDDAALGIYRGLCDLKLRVPQDVALVGCDGIEDTEYLECPLTTLVQPVSAMCKAAWEFLMKRLDHPETTMQKIILQPKLALRESSLRETHSAMTIPPI